VHPPMPFMTSGVKELAQRTAVARQAVVLIVAAQFRGERLELLGNFQMPVLPAPLRYLPNRSVQTARRRLPLDHPRPAAIRPLPVVSEPKQIERSRATTAAAFAVRLVGRFREPHQTSFLGMKLQPVFAESLRQYFH